MKKYFNLILNHKWYSVIILLVLLGGGYWGYKKIFTSTTTTRYVTAKVERGALITSISGTGQVSASNQIDIKTKAGGDVIYIGAKVGDEVKAGTLILSVNARDALKTVRDAEANLESAKLSLAKLTQPADTLSVLQAENSLAQAEQAEQQAKDNLTKSYEDGFSTVTNAFLDLPTVMAGLQSLLYNNDFQSTYNNIDWYTNQGASLDYNKYDQVIRYRDDVNTAYSLARKSYDINFGSYKNASRISNTSTLEALTIQTYETTKMVANAVKNACNFIDYVRDIMEGSSNITIPTLVTTQQSSLSSYTSKTNSHLSNLLSSKSSIEGYKNSIINNARTVAEKTESLANLKAGTDALDLASTQISVRQKENSLLDAREKLADYSFRAPFDGVVAQLTAKKGDTISAGSAVGAFITKQRIATIALNEVDIAKIKVGQKVNITFDALENLIVTGEVIEVDALGTTSQGVVSYNVKIAFDIQDDRIKPGMSMSANIIVASKPDVLMISTSAIKTQNGASYVEQLDSNGAPVKKDVEIGDSNDTATEIVNGLVEGDEIITQKITTTAAAAPATGTSNNRQGSGVRIPGMF